ncbi:hypothetical protein PVAND_011744 [Polypedilum vanderplanki]|uniref:DNA mismatch repair protein S5 domain-containing protein n=1 Tax=Polypedilum vanderplanki TaxID=319348 RepID=A0A9J6CKK8_POLVA|nr:hypothetical protein PVAND_011744 [Polypedilum vanderplanki]
MEQKIEHKSEMQAPQIIKLDDSVINRIAAGEIIQNPSNCVKELIENSIDAKAKQIQVNTKQNGLYIQIIDNGTGILKENLEILAERFTTSKLRKYEDLEKMSTYGFRGEALASIAEISRLTVQTKTRDQLFAYKAQYIGGKLIEEPTTLAGNQGTTITIDDLFYNVPMKTKTMTNDQFSKIFDVVSKYAIHNHRISFGLKKNDEKNNVIKTQPSDTPINAIRLIFGNNVANALIKVFIENIGLKFNLQGYVSKTDFNALKKGQFILFINHRNVESKSLKKALFEDVYRKILNVSVIPFIYLSLEVDPRSVDVNVSPTKHEVHLLNEDLIVESIKNVVHETLMKTNETKVMYAQKLLPGAPEIIFETPKIDKTYAKDMIRVDPKVQSITKFLKHNEDNQSANRSSLQIMPFSPDSSLRKSKNNYEQTKLTSVKELLADVESNCDENLKKQIRNLKFVGNINQFKSVIQSGHFLWCVSNRILAWHLFYQCALKGFSNFDAIVFNEPLKLRELTKIGLCVKKSETHKSKDILIDKVERVLVEKSEMLKEYFRISINKNGELESLPMLISNYAPLMSSLPIFIIRLVTHVSYENEKHCFKRICEELAKFYSQWSLKIDEKDYHRLMEDIIFPKIRSSLLPPKEFLHDTTFIKLTSLQDLYKIFERC